MLDFIARPLGDFLIFIYNTLAFHNYGLAIIMFTVVVKLVLLPLTVKQYKSSAKMQELQPITQDIQKRYKNDKEKLNQELMKVYKENNYNPAGGCLPMLVQMPILISLYYVIIQPLKFLLHKNPEQVTKLVAKATELMGAASKTSFYKEVTTLNYFNVHKESLSQVSGLLKPSELINMNFIGLHLGTIPSYASNLLFGPESYIYLPLLILPILAVISTFISTKLTIPKTNPQTKSDNPMANMSSSMMYIGPVMTLIFSFQVPASGILYWSVGYIFTIFQQLYINKHIIKRNVNTEVRQISENKGNSADMQSKSNGKKENKGNMINKGNKTNKSNKSNKPK